MEIKNVSLHLRANGRPLAQGLDFSLAAGERAVIIGEEGNGKSTLLAAIFDEGLVDGFCDFSGQIRRHGRMGYLPQFMPQEWLGCGICEYFEGCDAGDLPRLFARMGINPDLAASARPMGSLSGGEKIKLALARILLDNPDILLLDEPTNDLDLDTLEWLENFINACPQAVLYISHDEMLIERTASIIIHMEQLVRKSVAKITIAHSNYEDYARARGLAFDKQMQIAKKQRADHAAQMQRWRQIHDRVEHEQRKISRQNPGGGRLLKKKMKSIKSTGRRLERDTADFADIPQQEESILTQFAQDITIPRGKKILDMNLPALMLGERRLCGEIALNISGPIRIGIIGKNGVGKSTLLREIWAELQVRQDIRAAYMPQDYAEVLNYAQSALDFLAADTHKSTLTQARTYLGSMKFTPEEMLCPMGKLSGGQRAKILFLDMVLKRADVLLLDEPTRNFSPLSAPEIRATLQKFGGAIVSISHDRKYLADVCETIYELTKQGLIQK